MKIEYTPNGNVGNFSRLQRDRERGRGEEPHQRLVAHEIDTCCRVLL